MKKGTKKYYTYQYNPIFLNFLSFVTLIILFVITYYIYKGRDPLFLASTTYKSDIKFIVFVIGMILWMILHEVLHAICYRLSGVANKNIEMGITLESGVFYCSCREYISRKSILISSIIPFTLIGILAFVFGLLFNNVYLVIYSIINISGSVADIILFCFLLKLPKNIEYREYDDVLGFCVASNEDLSKIKSIGIKPQEVLNTDTKIVKAKSRGFHISPISILIIVIICIMLAASVIWSIK